MVSSILDMLYTLPYIFSKTSGIQNLQLDELIAGEVELGIIDK